MKVMFPLFEESFLTCYMAGNTNFRLQYQSGGERCALASSKEIEVSLAQEGFDRLAAMTHRTGVSFREHCTLSRKLKHKLQQTTRNIAILSLSSPICEPL